MIALVMNTAPLSAENNHDTALDPERYRKIEALNKDSFYLNEPQVFRVVTSIAGRETRLNPVDTYAGNMSEAWGRKYLPDHERIENARDNIDAFLRQDGIEVDPANVRILFPQRQYNISLKVIDIDSYPVDPTDTAARSAEERGDMLVTKNPNIILAVRPADCPVILAYGINEQGERVDMLAHIAHEGARAHFVDQFMQNTKALEIIPESLRVYITPGAQAENYNYTKDVNPLDNTEGLEKLYVNIHKTQKDNGETVFAYQIDTPNFVYEELRRLGLDTYQLFLDTSDTAAPNSQYASHGRSARSQREWEANGSHYNQDYEINKRDLIVAIPQGNS